jgi:ribosomal protein S4
MATRIWNLPPAARCRIGCRLTQGRFKGVVMRIPTRDEIQPIANEQAVVEFYSR